MAKIIKRTWFISIDFLLKDDEKYDLRLKVIKDFFKEIGFVESSTTSLVTYDDDDLLEAQVQSELISVLREEAFSNPLDVTVLRSVVRTSSKTAGKTVSVLKQHIWLLDKNEMEWQKMTERALYNKLKKEHNKKS